MSDTFALCPTDGEPLITSFATPGYEFLCMVCGRHVTFFGPDAGDPTPERAARYADLKARFDAGERP